MTEFFAGLRISEVYNSDMGNQELIQINDKDSLYKARIVEFFYPDQVKDIEENEDKKLRELLGDDVANLEPRAEQDNLIFEKLMEDEEFRKIESRLGAGGLMTAIMSHSQRFAEQANKLGISCSEEDRVDTVNRLIKRIKTVSGNTETEVLETLIGTLYSDLKSTRIKKQKELFYKMSVNPAVLKNKIENEVLDGDSIKTIEDPYSNDIIEKYDYSWARGAKKAIDVLFPDDVSGLSVLINKVVELTVVAEYDRVKVNKEAAINALEVIFEKCGKAEISLNEKTTERLLTDAVLNMCSTLKELPNTIPPIEKAQLKKKIVNLTCWLMEFGGNALPLPEKLTREVVLISNSVNNLFDDSSIPKVPKWYGKEIKFEDITMALEVFGVYKQ